VSDLIRKYTHIQHFYLSCKFLYIQPDGGPTGPKHIAYMMIQSCVRWYFLFYYFPNGRYIDCLSL